MGDITNGAAAAAPSPLFDEADVIYSYTRQQALADGVLVDVSERLPEARIPVDVTASVWALLNDIPPSHSYQSLDGRLWDMYAMGIMAARRNPQASEVVYRLIMHHGRQTYVTLKLCIGPADDGAPVFTFLMEHED